MDCVECDLPVTPYKQNEQIQPDLCESCHIIIYDKECKQFAMKMERQYHVRQEEAQKQKAL